MTAAVSRSVPSTPHSTRSTPSPFRTQPIPQTTTAAPHKPTLSSLLALSNSLPPPSPAPASRSAQLLAAAKVSDTAAVGRLVASTVLPATHALHANVNESDEWGMAALHYAALTGNAEMCEELLAHGANANQRDRYGLTPLLLASSKCHYLALQQLLAHKASVAILPATLVTPLHRIAACPHPHQLLCADALLRARQKLDAQTTEGETALHVAVRSGSLALLSWLLSHHANPNLPNRHGQTPLDAATAESLIEDELLSYGAVGSRSVSVDASQRGAVRAAERRRVEEARRVREAASAAAAEEQRRLGEVRAKWGQAEIKEGLDGKWDKEEQAALTARQQPQTAQDGQAAGQEEESKDGDEQEDEEGGEVVMEEEDDEEARRAYREKMYSMWAERQAAASTSEPVVRSAWA